MNTIVKYRVAIVALLLFCACKKKQDNIPAETKQEVTIFMQSGSDQRSFSVGTAYAEDLGVLTKGNHAFDVVYDADIREYVLTFVNGTVSLSNKGGFSIDSFSDNCSALFSVSLNSADTNALVPHNYRFKLNQVPGDKIKHYPGYITDFSMLYDLQVDKGNFKPGVGSEIFEADSGYFNLSSINSSTFTYDCKLYLKNGYISSKGVVPYQLK